MSLRLLSEAKACIWESGVGLAGMMLRMDVLAGTTVWVQVRNDIRRVWVMIRPTSFLYYLFSSQHLAHHSFFCRSGHWHSLFLSMAIIVPGRSLQSSLLCVHYPPSKAISHQAFAHRNPCTGKGHKYQAHSMFLHDFQVEISWNLLQFINRDNLSQWYEVTWFLEFLHDPLPLKGTSPGIPRKDNTSNSPIFDGS